MSSDTVAVWNVVKYSLAWQPRTIVIIQQPQTRRLRKILICGLPGAGKTTLSRLLAPRMGAVLFNADEIRSNINKDLGFTHPDRIEHARRMGWLCDRVADAGSVAIADFVCPTPQTRAAFGEAFIVWVDRIRQGRFDDTNKLFVAPTLCDIRVGQDGDPEFWVEKILTKWSNKSTC